MHYEAKFTPTVEDAMSGYRMHQRMGDNSWKLFLFFGGEVAVIFGVGAIMEHAPFLALVGILGGAVVFGAPMLVELSVRRRAKKAPRSTELRFCFSDEGFECSSGADQFRLTWDLITKASLDERGLLLHMGSMHYFFIPARAFVSGYFPRQELKSFLTAKLTSAATGKG